MDQNQITLAFIGFGEVNSPRQLILDKCSAALEELRSLDLAVISTEPVTDDADGKDVKRALDEIGTRDFDLLILCIAGWIPSHAVISVTERFRSKPMILWGLAGDRIHGKIVTPAPQAGTTALRKVFQDLGYRFRFVYNIIGRPSPLDQIKSFADAVSATRNLRNSKVGMLGYRDMKLYNTLYEGISLKTKFGVEVEFFEMLEMLQESETVRNEEIMEILSGIRRKWVFEKPVDGDFLKKGVAYFLALKRIAGKNRLNAISIKDVDGMKKILKFPPAMIFMLLADETGLCTIPENDVMGAVTQLVVKNITGQCAAYLEFYEFFEKSVLMGVPDFVPAEVVDGKVRVTSAAFGDLSGGVLNISELKSGRLTLVRISNTGSEYAMHVATGHGERVAWEEAGWDAPAPQLPSLEIFLDAPVEAFAQKVSGQHYIIAYGDHRQALYDYCYLNEIEFIEER
jgi:L-arabinose isomerase